MSKSTTRCASQHNYIGVDVVRREDARLLTGGGCFVGDLQLPNMLDAVLVRSQHAHADIEAVDVLAARAAHGVKLALSGHDLVAELNPIEGMQVHAPPGWSARVQQSTCLPAQAIIATDKAHFVGEALAVVVASSATTALDAAELVVPRLRPLPAVVDPERAISSDDHIIHTSLGSNLLSTMTVEKGDAESALAQAPHRLRRRISHHRYAAMPMECRGVVADFDARSGVLTLWSASQVVFWVRAQVAQALGMAEAQVRVIAPDVGGGFGVKGHVYPEEILIAYLARRLGRPVRWLEQRQEHFIAATHSRDNIHDVEFGFDDTGRILALRDHSLVDSGAYCPVGAGVAYNTTAHLLGPYQVPHFAATTRIACTNKTPNAPYRGAGRPEAVQVMERVLDIIAATLGHEPAEVRFKNLIQPEQMPYAVGLPYRDGAPIVYDSGDYPRALRRALQELGGVGAFRERQRAARAQGRLLGLGLACYTEGTGVGPFEGARVQLDLSGKLIVALGACPQGQGQETVFAQVAAQSWQMPIDDVIVMLADSSALAMGYGTVGSRSTVTASMALEGASATVKRKVLRVAGEMLEASAEDLQFHDGGVCVAGASELRVSLAEVARAALPGWQHQRPRDVEAGLDASFYYEPQTVTWSYAANAAVIEIDTETGQIAIEQYVEVHDAGVLVNPTLADGQVTGGIVQGLGGALLEAMVYDDNGQLLSGSFLDYAMPRARDVPPLNVVHQQTPSPLNDLGIKGLGEGGAIAPPVVVANALADALRETAQEFNDLPIRPEAVRAALTQLQR